MRFTRLRLNGFKSFVDPTEMSITDGLTGVVGPNGCGKSNLVEGLRWVMGESRPTAMRGEGMEDVIFAGAAGRPARAFAEVALVIDDAAQRLPQGLADADRVEIARRITRDGGSAFRANGREVRARDVAVLFADAGSGAGSPSLVRQGQIGELVAARPRARRRVIEDAAGIAGLHARRQEAEQRLAATEANLARIADVAEALKAQLGQLGRQARAAARYREIGAALRRAEGLLLLCRWQAAEAARGAAAAARDAALRQVAGAEVAARAAARDREAAEAALPPRREEAAIAAAVAARLGAERAGLEAEAARAAAEVQEAAARLTQIEADLAREEALGRDAGETMAGLAEEVGRIARAGDGQEGLVAAAAAAARAAAVALEAREAAAAAATEDAAALAARHQSAVRLLAEAEAAEARAAAEAARAGQAAGEAAAAEAGAAAAAVAAGGARATAQVQADGAEATLALAEAARAEATGREGAARAARAAAEGELAALRAEAAALARLLAREPGSGRQLLDLVRVAEGFEAALGAALGEDLEAPSAVPGGAAGWETLAAYPDPPPLPAGAAPLAQQVAGTPALARRLSQTGVVAAADGPRLQPLLGPGQRLVSREGDLWRWDGLRAAAGSQQATAALRLVQINRLAALKRDLAMAEARAAGAAQAHEELKARAVSHAEAEAAGRIARREADRKLAEAARALARAEADGSLAAARGEAARAAAEGHAAEAAAAAARRAAARAALAGLPDPAAARAAQAAARAAAEAARAALLAARGEEEGLRRAAEGRARRVAEIAREQERWQARLAAAADRRRDLQARRAAAAAAAEAAARAPAEIGQRQARLAAALAAAVARQTRAAEALAADEAGLRTAAEAEREAERAAAAAREARAAAEAATAAATAAETEAAQRIAAETGAAPAALAALQGGGEPPEAAAIEAEVGRLRRAREALGAVNLRAEEDLAAAAHEHATIEAERADLAQAVARLRGGIGALNREARERLLTAFEQVNTNFAGLFAQLFGGGEARLVLVESDDPLEAGLEILAQPPGKKLATLSLLSGGEQTLTALALVFAVFLANPAPVSVLDEVDAPLDDANVARFCDLLAEIARRTGTRFLVITHHPVTMARMDRLYGVTMVEPGVSQLVSVDLRRAEALVA